ncbi:hypothetical protein [Actinorugispora endophytica]|uniref:MinD-like ATPase involved in chromosome partitioning or flagellar assembly n=1 Tax=Actinorugispora endophytica TaxID=1605990 RepID=A0A4R6V4C0_9ACTN|nr:hypothetical protein [Actinorugispora endophytica]TDQ55104.1 hypothetical protein EV190_101427 [Actinorugispora endophytica]
MTRTVALFSLGGAPGVTTLSMALASVWPGEAGAVLVEADASGGDIATRYRLHASPALIDLAAAARRGPAENGGATGGPLAHSQALPGGLPVCAAPTTADRANGAVELLAQNPGILGADQAPAVVVDLGRLAPRSPAARLAMAADVVVLVVQDDLAQLRRVKDSAAAFREAFRDLRVVVRTGADSTSEIAEATGLPVAERIGRDDKAAAFLRGERNDRRPHKRPLFKTAAVLARRLAEETAPIPAPDTRPVGVQS